MNFPMQSSQAVPEPAVFNDIAEYHYRAGVLNNPYIFVGVILGILVVLLIAFFVWRYYRRPHILLPWEWAFRELEKFDPSRYEQQADFAAFYVGLTRVLKWYVERRFDLSVNHKTDDEVVVFLKQQATSRRDYAELYQAVDTLYSDLEKLFEGAKYVKFAQVAALRDRASADLETAREFIKRTVPAKK